MELIHLNGCVKLSNYNQIPYEYGGGKVDIEDQTLNASTSVSVTPTANSWGTKTFSSSNLPSGLSLNSSSGLLSGTLAVGTYTFNLTLSNNYSSSKTVTITLIVS